MVMREPQFRKGPLHVVDQGPDKFPIVCGEGGTDAWFAVVNNGPAAMANAQLFAHAGDLYAEADRARIVLVIASGFVEGLDPKHAAAMRGQALEIAKVLAKARGE